MKFCPKCGTKLRYRQVKIEEKSEPALACDKCGYWEPVAKSTAKPMPRGSEGDKGRWRRGAANQNDAYHNDRVPKMP